MGFLKPFFELADGLRKDIKAHRESKRKDKLAKDLEEGRATSARKRFYAWLRGTNSKDVD